MIVSDTVRFIALIIIFFLSINKSTLLPLGLPLVAAVISLMNAQTFVALETFLSHSFFDDQKARVMVWLQIAEQASVVIGPLLGFFVQSYLGSLYILPIAGLFFGLSMIILYFISEEKQVKHVSSASNSRTVASDLFNGWMKVYDNKKLLKLAFAASAMNIICGLDVAASAPVLIGKIGLESTSYGYLQVVCGVASLGFMFLLPKFNLDKHLDMAGILAFLSIILGSIIASFSYDFITFSLAVILSNLPLGILNVYIRTRRSELIAGAANRGVLVGILLMLGQLGLPLSGLLLASVSGSFGAFAFKIAAAIGFMSFCLLFYQKLKSFLNKNRILTS